MAKAFYRNDSDKVIDVIGIGEIPPGEHVSLTGDHLPPVIVENYPGLVDVLAEEAAAAEAEVEAPSVQE